ncbi:MAG TPA: hypothetical protein PKH10_02070 [bacterium]|nr:hypothetical protein [bacterium]
MSYRYRTLAHSIKEGNGIPSAAFLIWDRIREESSPVFIPMPSHTGKPSSWMRDLCWYLARLSGGTVIDALRGNRRMSLYLAKKQRKKVTVKMKQVHPVPANAFIVDNVIATGLTMRTAQTAIAVPTRPLALTVASRHP